MRPVDHKSDALTTTSPRQSIQYCFALVIYRMYALNRFCRHADENKRQKVALILDKLITMTIDEVEVGAS